MDVRKHLLLAVYTVEPPLQYSRPQKMNKLDNSVSQCAHMLNLNANVSCYSTGSFVRPGSDCVHMNECYTIFSCACFDVSQMEIGWL